MKKTLATILSLLLVSTALNAMRPRLSYGLEWGYTGTFLNTWQYNYIYSSGSRIIDNDLSWRYFSNGSLLANVGMDLGDKVNLSLYSGIHGVYFKRRMIPLGLRARWCPAGLYNNGCIMYVGSSALFPTAPLHTVSPRADIGAGYRVKVYKTTSVDFLLSFAVSGDHKSITDPDTSAPVPEADITKNYAQYWGVAFSIALNF